MHSMGTEWPNLALLLPACFLASLVSGIAGFAFGAVAVALVLPLGPAPMLVPLILIGSIVGQVTSLAALRRAVDWPKMLPFLAGGLVGVPVGTAALLFADPHAFRISLGVILILFSLYGLLRGTAAPISFGGRPADLVVGAIGGAMGGYAGLSGILPTIWCGLRGWPREEQRAVYQPFILVIQICALLSGGAAHVFSADALLLAAACMPSFLLGTFSGLWVFGKLDEKRFRLAVLVLLLLSGAAQLA